MTRYLPATDHQFDVGAVAESTVGGAVSGGLFEAGAGLVAKGLACSDALATRAAFRSPSLKSNAVLDGVSTVSIDGSGKDIGADENASSTPDRYFRAIVLTPEIEQYVAENGFISGKLRVLVQEAGGALPESYPLEERIVQYVEGTPDS